MKQRILSFRALNLLSILLTTVVSSEPIPPANTTVRPSPNKNLRDCDCFTVSGPDPGYFQYYKLWDFRSVPLRVLPAANSTKPDKGDGRDWSDWYIKSLDNEEDEDDEEGYDQGVQEPEADALWFSQTAFDKDWVSQQWERPRNPNAPVDMINSKRNVFFTRNRGQHEPHATYLVLRTTRYDDHASTAEIETRIHNIFHCSLRVRLRILPSDIVISQPNVSGTQPPPDLRYHTRRSPNNRTSLVNGISPVEVGRPLPGACVGIFTYQARDCESDIEILTSDPPHRIRYANQPDYDPITDMAIPGASSIVDLPVPWTTWSTHRLDWFPHVSRWWVDDRPQAANGYQVPNAQSRLVINLWSDGGVWTGDMRVGESIFLGIEYIELAYNRSSDGTKPVIPPSRRHGGHQNVSAVAAGEDDDFETRLWEPDTETVTGTVKGRKKCKKGKKGAKCRKKQRKGKKGDKHRGESRCRRVCNIDDFRLHEFPTQR